MNKIDIKVSELKKLNKIGLMGHIIAGYPDFDRSIEAAFGLIDGGVDILEIQFPFSDPTADGPVIESACYESLSNGFKVNDGFRILKEITKYTDIPVLVMTYANIAYKYGLEKFIEDISNCGGCGVIIPDLPPENDEGLIKSCSKFQIHNIVICAPNTDAERIKILSKNGSGFIYTILREGTTGDKTEITQTSIDRINYVKTCTGLPVAVGFGIGSSEQIDSLRNIADIVIVGSHFVRIINNSINNKQNIRTNLNEEVKKLT